MKRITIPANMKIINNKDFQNIEISNYKDTQYFRLIHKLKNVGLSLLPDGYHFSIVDVTKELIIVQNIINNSYEDIRVTIKEIESWLLEPVFDNSLWIFIIDNFTNEPIGLGIADLDCELKEGILEWIQLLPKYRGKGLAYALVSELLLKLKPKANFVTVSGKLDNILNPEKLYRKCGFEGDDVWHILYAK